MGTTTWLRNIFGNHFMKQRTVNQKSSSDLAMLLVGYTMGSTWQVPIRFNAYHSPTLKSI